MKYRDKRGVVERWDANAWRAVEYCSTAREARQVLDHLKKRRLAASQRFRFIRRPDANTRHVLLMKRLKTLRATRSKFPIRR